MEHDTSSSESAQDGPIHVEAHVIGNSYHDGPDTSTPQDSKHSKGVKQMVAGGILMAAGIPMMILPGPGAAALAGGAILLGKGYKNATGNDMISEETRNDPDYQAGQAAGEAWAQRVKDFARDDVAPAAKDLGEGLKEGASSAWEGIKKGAAAGGKLASKGFRVIAGDKAADTVEKVVTPVASTACAVGKAAVDAASPLAEKAAKKGSEVASAAAAKAAQKARDLMSD